jgi:hypothetical protein
MGGILGAAIDAIAEGLKLARAKNATKWSDRMVELQLDIQKEEARGYDSDDAKIESMYKELGVIMVAAREEIKAAVVGATA